MRITVTLLLLASSQLLSAHPSGHEGTLSELSHHIVSSPWHLVQLGGALMLLAATAYFWTKKRRGQSS
ncbi:MAG: hypothetical protein AAF065_13480 [Verrucomicrobiota bacterium]